MTSDRGPRTRGPRTRGPQTHGPRTRGPRARGLWSRLRLELSASHGPMVHLDDFEPWSEVTRRAEQCAV